MEFYEIKNKLLRVLDNKEFMDSVDQQNTVEAIDIYMDDESIQWNDIAVEVFFYIHLCYDKNDKSSNYDVYGFQLGVDGYLVDYNHTDNTFHATFPGFITPEFDEEIYTNLVDAYIESSELCPMILIPELPNPIVKILKDSGTFEFFSLDDKIWLYDQTKNGIFLEKEVLDIFIF